MPPAEDGRKWGTEGSVVTLGSRIQRQVPLQSSKKSNSQHTHKTKIHFTNI